MRFNSTRSTAARCAVSVVLQTGLIVLAWGPVFAQTGAPEIPTVTCVSKPGERQHCAAPRATGPLHQRAQCQPR